MLNWVSLRPIFTWNPADGMPDFIKTLYQNILSRDPLPEDHPNIDHWMNHTRFHGIASTISSFFTSDKFKAKNFPQGVVVDKLYRSILGREGRWDGRNYWIDRLRHGDAVQTTVSKCIESAEYRQKAQASIVPPSAVLVYCLLNSLSTMILSSITDLYLHGIQLVVYLILSKHCITMS